MIKDIKLSMIAVFAALYMILPSYFAIELSSSLPLITASRILLLLLVVIYLLKNNWEVSLKIAYERTANRVLVIFFTLVLLTDFIHLPSSATIKNMLSVLIEELLVIWVMTKVITTKREIVYFLRIAVYASGIVAIFSIIGSLLGVNFFNYLITVDRELLIVDFERMGLLRPQAGFDHAVHYGLYNAIMCSIAMSLAAKEKGKKYILLLGCLFLDLAALILANSRGSLFAFILVCLFRTLKCLKNNSINVRNARRIINIIFVITCCITVVIFIVPEILEYIWNVFFSVYASLFNTNAMSSIGNYGTNVGGIASRLAQFSGIFWVLTRRPFFGMGPDATANGLISYINMYTGDWYVTDTFDVGYIEIFCTYGIVGSIAYILLFGLILKIIFSKKKSAIDNSDLQSLFQYAVVTYFIGILSVDISGTSKVFWVLFALLLCYLNSEKKSC